jgi:hypothetical protein
MFSSINNYFKKIYTPFHKQQEEKQEKQEDKSWFGSGIRDRTLREKRFPNVSFNPNLSVVRSIYISMDELSPKYIYNLIEKYYENLDHSNHRYEWLRCWLPIIENELNDLNKYTMENVGRIVIIQNDKAIFDFYLIQDIHIQDIDTVVIDLNHDLYETDYVSNTILSLSMLFSAGSLGYFLSNLF